MARSCLYGATRMAQWDWQVSISRMINLCQSARSDQTASASRPVTRQPGCSSARTRLSPRLPPLTATTGLSGTVMMVPSIAHTSSPRHHVPRSRESTAGPRSRSNKNRSGATRPGGVLAPAAPAVGCGHRQARQPRGELAPHARIPSLQPAPQR
jgi:hypothetical protein